MLHCCFVKKKKKLNVLKYTEERNYITVHESNDKHFTLNSIFYLDIATIREIAKSNEVFFSHLDYIIILK